MKVIEIEAALSSNEKSSKGPHSRLVTIGRTDPGPSTTEDDPCRRTSEDLTISTT